MSNIEEHIVNLERLAIDNCCHSNDVVESLMNGAEALAAVSTSWEAMKAAGHIPELDQLDIELFSTYVDRLNNLFSASVLIMASTSSDFPKIIRAFADHMIKNIPQDYPVEEAKLVVDAYLAVASRIEEAIPLVSKKNDQSVEELSTESG